MHRQHTITAALIVALSLLAIRMPVPASAASSTGATAHRDRVALESYSDARIVAICDRTDSGESMGLSRPSVVDRIGGVDAVIFATNARYSACIVFGDKNVESNEPTAIRKFSHGVGELESFGTLDKIEGRGLYSTDTWFVVRVSPTVSAIKAVVRGSSQVTKVQDQFAFVHESERVGVHGKFVYGEVVGFSATGDVVGSGLLR